MDYDRTRADFHLYVPDRFNFVRDVVEPWANDPQRLALWWIDDRGAEQQITYARLIEGANRAAGALRAAGVDKGDRVFIMIGRLPGWWESMLACLKIGAVAMPATVQLQPKDIAYRLELASPAGFITESTLAGKVDEVRDKASSVKAFLAIGEARDGWAAFDAPASSDAVPTTDTAASDPALLYFTSGTTGNPKMVQHTQASYGVGHTITGKMWLDLQPGDVHWNISDTGWAKAAWSSFYGPLIAGATVFVHNPASFDARRILDILSSYPITSVCGPPTVFRSLVLEDLSGYAFPKLESCVAAGEPLNPEVIESWRRATGIQIRDGFGQTESVLLVGNFPGVPIKPGSMGKPSPGFDVAVVGDRGQRLPAGKEGDIAVNVNPRPVGLFREYWNNPEANRACSRGEWYITGDRGIQDEDGYLWFVGRADDVIISAGYRIGPFEVESALIEHEAVAESAAVQSPDPIRGAIVKAFVILAPGFAASEDLAKALQEHVKNVTAPYKYPREIEFVDSLPKTVSGKIRRIELREREYQRKTSKAVS